MQAMQRRSPVSFGTRPLRSEARDGWPVVREYTGEGPGPWLVDLSHRRRWDVQDGRIDRLRPWGLALPGTPGACDCRDGLLAGRLNATQAAVWHLAGEAPPAPEGSAFTEVTEAGVLLAVVGAACLGVAEKLSRLDLADPVRPERWLHQGPFAHVPAQVVAWRGSQGDGALLVACSRGYGRDLVHAVMDAGAAFGLRPAGEAAFHGWLARVEAAA